MNGFKIKQQIRKAEHLYRKEKYTDALRVLKDLIYEVKEEAPDIYTFGLIRIGDIYRKEGAEQSAASNYRQALSMMQRSPELEKVIPSLELFDVYYTSAVYCEKNNRPEEMVLYAERGIVISEGLDVCSDTVYHLFRICSEQLYRQGRLDEARTLLRKGMDRIIEVRYRAEIYMRLNRWFSETEEYTDGLYYTVLYFEEKIRACEAWAGDHEKDDKLKIQLELTASRVSELRNSLEKDPKAVNWTFDEDGGFITSLTTGKELESNLILYLIRQVLPEDPEGKCELLTDLLVELLQDLYGDPFTQMYRDLEAKMNALDSAVDQSGISIKQNQLYIKTQIPQKEIHAYLHKALVKIEKCFCELETAEYPVILGENESRQQQSLLLNDGRSQLLFMVRYIFRRYHSAIKVWTWLYDTFAEKAGAEDDLLGQMELFSGAFEDAQFCELRGWELFNSGQYRKAEYFFDQAVILTLQQDGSLRDYEKDRFLMKGALRTAYRLGKFDKALVFAIEREQLILEHLKRNENDQGAVCWLVETYSYLMAIHVQLRNITEAVAYFKKTDAVEDQQIHFSIMPDAMVYVACGDWFSGRYIDFVKSILEEYDSDSLRFNQKPLLAVIGLDQKRNKQYVQAADSFYKALQNHRDEKCMVRNFEAMPFGEDGMLLVNLFSSIILAGDRFSTRNGLVAISLAYEYMKDRCIKAYEIYDEEERYYHLRICRHLMSLCHSYSLKHPGLLTGREIRELALCAAGVGGEISVQSAEWLVREKAGIRSAYDRLLFLQKKQQEECPVFTMEQLTSPMGQEIHQLEGEVLRCLARADKKEKLESLRFRFDRDLPDGSLILHFGSFYYTDGIYDEEGYAGDAFGLEKTDGFPYARYYYMTLYHNKEALIFYLDKTEVIDQLVKEYTEELRTSADGGRSKRLWDSLLSPVRESIDRAKHVYIVPEGELCRVPFELLKDGTGKRLMDMVDSVEYLSSVQRIRKIGAEQKEQKEMMILADPAFHAEEDKDAVSGEYLASGFVRDPGVDLFRNGIAPLPGTALESSAIRRVCERAKLRVICYEGKEASKKQLEEIRADILHFATHSFAFPQSRDRLEERTRDGLFYGTWFSHAPNPLQRCGLILAGAENALQNEPVQGCGDGILTGYEVLSRDMSGVDLLVLASCNSGAGFIQNGEGMKGLRSAFEVAGVKNILCSLWEVPDIPSAILMYDFYRGFLLEHRPMSDALNTAREKLKSYTSAEIRELLSSIQAQSERVIPLNERELDLLDLAEPEEKPFAAPYFWAGFIRIRCG